MSAFGLDVSSEKLRRPACVTLSSSRRKWPLPPCRGASDAVQIWVPSLLQQHPSICAVKKRRCLRAFDFNSACTNHHKPQEQGGPNIQYADKNHSGFQNWFQFLADQHVIRPDKFYTIQPIYSYWIQYESREVSCPGPRGIWSVLVDVVFQCKRSPTAINVVIVSIAVYLYIYILQGTPNWPMGMICYSYIEFTSLPTSLNLLDFLTMVLVCHLSLPQA